jgi:hypothetical protein
MAASKIKSPASTPSPPAYVGSVGRNAYSAQKYAAGFAVQTIQRIVYSFFHS